MSKLSIRITTKEFLIWATIEIIAIASAFVIADVESVEYRMLFLLPLSYCLLNILFVRNYVNRAFDSFTILLLHGFYFVRIVLAPLFWTLSGAHYSFHSNSNISGAIYLMIYEMFVVYVVMLVWTSRMANTTQQGIVITDKIFNRSKILILVIIIVLCGLLVMNPNSVMLYRSGLGFFDYEFTGFTSTDIIRQYSGSLISKFGIVTFRYVFNISRVIIPCIIGLMMKYKNKRSASIIIYTLIATVVFNFLIMDDTLAYSICYSLIIIVFLSRLLDKKDLIKKALIIAAGLVLLFFV